MFRYRGLILEDNRWRALIVKIRSEPATSKYPGALALITSLKLLLVW